MPPVKKIPKNGLIPFRKPPYDTVHTRLPGRLLDIREIVRTVNFTQRDIFLGGEIVVHIVLEQDSNVFLPFFRIGIRKIRPIHRDGSLVRYIQPAQQLDVVLLPLLAFDEKGCRLGYGKGFYDRFLKRLSERGVNPCRIGLSFFQQRVDKLPSDPWDEPLDAVVHEQGIIRYT